LQATSGPVETVPCCANGSPPGDPPEGGGSEEHKTPLSVFERLLKKICKTEP